jgi:hypothetical protein
MLDQLINLVKEKAGGAIINNPAIPNEKNEEAIQTTGNSIMSGIQAALAGGGLSSLMGMFSGRQNVNDSPVTKSAMGNVIENLKAKVGLDNDQATQVAGQVVPDVMNGMVQKTNDPNDNSFNIQDIFNNLTGGKTSGMNMSGLMEKYRSGAFDADGDGDTDFNDLKAMLSGGMGSGGGSIFDKVKGMFN